MPNWVFLLIHCSLICIPFGIYFFYLRWKKDYPTRTLIRYTLRAILLLVFVIFIGCKERVSWFAFIGVLVLNVLNNLLFKGEAKADYYKW